MDAVISRETQVENWRRKWKINLIASFNPEMTDLTDEIVNDVWRHPKETID